MSDNDEEIIALSPKDFASDQEVKWCPGCGDYSILKQVHTVFPSLGVPKEKFVFISGIGCSSRFTYYMNTYGMHGIHGRAAVLAEGVKLGNPDLDVWIASGDGDALSIGGNHFMHFFRKNFNIKMLVFNNQIYSLTKGQYSPTSERGKVTKTSPFGAIEEPANPVGVALGSKATFVARTLDRDPKHMQEMIKRAHQHKGGAMIEVYQNCPIFNDGSFFMFSEKETKKDTTLLLKQGMPLKFGEGDCKGIRLDGLVPVVVNLNENDISDNDLWIHDEQDKAKAFILSTFSDLPYINVMPRPFGVVYSEQRTVYEEDMEQQVKHESKNRMSLDNILSGEKTWEVK